MNKSAFSFGTLAIGFAALFSGCAGRLSITGTARGVVHGKVHGGQQPVSGASMQLYAVGTGGDGSAATPLLTPAVLTDANGDFNIPSSSYTCPSSTALVYLVATGGNPGLGAGQTNPQLALVAALGQCGNISNSTNIVVNELTTVAAVYALAPYMMSASAVGSGTSDAAALASAFTLASQYVNVTYGTAPGVGVPSGMVDPVAQINTVGDIVATCVNSAGGAVGDGSICGTFFSLTTPTGGTAATDTIAALQHLAGQPTLNTAGLYNLAPPAAPFQPMDATQPPDLSISLTAVTVSCNPGSILTTQTSTCSLSASGGGSVTNTVTWSVSPTGIGSISSAGVFTPTTAGTAIITGTSTQDPTKFGSTTVIVSVVPTISSVGVMCGQATLLVPGTDQCNGDVQGNGAYDPTVTWSVNGVSGGNSTVGTISSSGLYVAPATIPAAGNPVTISAASVADSSKVGTSAITLSYPAPVLSSIFPLSVAAGSSDTTLQVNGTGFSQASTVNFLSQSLQTTHISTTQLLAVIPSSQLSSAGAALVSVASPTPGGGTSSTALFTITQVAVPANLVILATPAYPGSPSGPWVLSVAAADSNGNPVPNLPITLSSSEGTISQNAAATDLSGALTGSITPPTTYANEVIEVSAISGSQTAVVDIVFSATATTVGQQVAAQVTRTSGKDFLKSQLRPSNSPISGASGSGISQMLVGTSNGAATNNLFSGMLSPCTSNQELDTTQSVGCQSEFSASQIQFTPYSPSSNTCSAVGNVKGIASCAGATGILVACAFPESGVGALICAGGLDIEDDLAEECGGYIANGIAQSLASNNAIKGAAGETIVNIATLAQGANSTDLVSVECNAIDAANAVNIIEVTPSLASAQLGQQVQFTANANVTWSVMNGTFGGSLGTITPNGGLYTAPLVAPTQVYCSFLSAYYADACPVTIVATSTSNPGDQTVTTVLLSISSDAAPSISSLAPNSIAAGSAAQQISINGSGFLDGDSVTFNGSPRPSSFIGTDQLKVSLSTADLASVGSFPLVVTHSFLTLPGYGGSATGNLTVIAAQTPVPPVPSPTSPGTSTDTGFTVGTTTPTLQWNASQATQFDLAISQYPYGTNNVIFDSGILNGGTSTLTVPIGYLLDGIKYRWNMQSHNNAGWSAVSSPLYFTVSAGSAPAAPSPISPGTNVDTGYQVSTTTPTMQWSGSGATQYELAISQSPYGSSNVIYDTLLAGTATSQPIPSGRLQNGVKYRWDMQATNAGGQSPWSAPLYFMVNLGSGVPPSVPIPLSPGTNANTGYQVPTATPTMQWSGSGATQYELAISQYPYGANNVVYDTLPAGTATSQPIPSGTLQNGVNYRWNMQATNSAGQSSWSGPLYFTVAAAVPTPTITSVFPNPVTGSNSAQPFTITGTGFTSQSTVTLHDVTAGQDFPNRAISSQTSTQIVLNPVFTTAADSWWVEVVNGSQTSNQYTFQVNAPVVAPTITSVFPNPVTGSNSAQPFTITGTGFTSQSTVTLHDVTAGQDFPNRTISSQTSTQIVLNPIFTTAADSWWVEVVNGSQTSNQYTFQVNAPVVAPTITSVFPNPVTGSNSAQPFTITGTGFTSQSTVTLHDVTAGQDFPNRTISSQTSTQIVLNPIFTTAADSWWVEVVNGSRTSNQYTFQVNAPVVAPTITSVFPNPVTGSNSAQPFTITGTGFTGQSTVTLHDVTAGQDFPNRTISSQTSTQIVLNPIFTTAADSWWVEVVNGSQTSNQYTFQVNAPAPTVSSISPTSMTADNTNHTLTIFGGNFQPGNIVQFQFTGSNGWVNGRGNPPTIVNTGQMTISLNPGKVTDTIYVRVCQSASLTAASNCSSGTQSIVVH